MLALAGPHTYGWDLTALAGPHTYKWDLLAPVCRAAHLRVIYVSTFVEPHTYELDLLSTRAAHLWVGYVTTWRAAHLHVRFVTTFVFHVFQASCKEVNWVWASLLFWFKISLEKLDKPFAKNNHRQLYTMFLATLWFSAKMPHIPHSTCMRARVSLQVEGVVEPLAAEGAEVSLHVAVALHVPVEQPLQRECFLAHPVWKREIKED